MALPKINQGEQSLAQNKKSNSAMDSTIKNLDVNKDQLNALGNIQNVLQKQNDYFKQFLEAQKEANARMAASMALKDPDKAKAAKDSPEAKGIPNKKLDSGWLGTLLKSIGMGLSLWATGIADYLRVFQLPRAIRAIGRLLGFAGGGAIGKLFQGISDSIFKVTEAFRDVWNKRGTMKYLKTSSYNTLGKLTGIVRDFVNWVAKVENFFKGIGSTIQGWAKAAAENKYVQKFLDSAKGVIDWFKNIGSKIGGFFSDVGSKVGGIFTRVADFLKPILGFAKTAFGFLKPLLGLFRWLGGPLSMIIFAAIDGIVGFIDGWKNGGFLDGLEGAFTGIIKGIIAAPLDLLKDLVGWLAGLMGFKDFKAWLGEWSFSAMFDKLWSAYKAFFAAIGDWFVTLFTDPKAALMQLVPTWLTNFGTWLYDKAIKPIVDWFGTLFTDPLTALKELWNTYVAAYANFGQLIYNKAIKPVIDYIGSLFGAEDASGSFEALIKEKWDSIKNFGKNIYDKYLKPIFDKISNLFSGKVEINLPSFGDAKEMAKKLIKSILKAILPRKDPNGSWYNVSNLASKAIPESVYKYAGIDKATGKDIPEAPKPEDGEKLEKGQEGADAAKANASSAGPTVVNGGSTSNNNSSNNSTNSVTIHVGGRSGGKQNAGPTAQGRTR